MNAFQQLPPLSHAQVGFLKGMSTQVNINSLLKFTTKHYTLYHTKYLKLFAASRQMNHDLQTFLLFIDYEQVYNSVRMDKLKSRLESLSSLSKNEIDLLFWGYSQLKIQLGSEEFTPHHGVPQGGINSPILFDFALYFMMEDLVKYLKQNKEKHSDVNKQKINITEENSFLFADDTVFALHLRGTFFVIKETLKTFYHSLNQVGLTWA